MKNKKRILLWLLIVSVFTTFLACKEETSLSLDDLKKPEGTVTTAYSFQAEDTSGELLFDENKLQEFQTLLTSTRVEYGYEELFDYEKALWGIQVDHTVSEHRYSALDSDGKLTKEHLLEVVKANNVAYLSKNTSLLKKLDDEYLLRICEILVEVTNDTLEKYPDIDRDRVYCNLGYLKVIEKGGALDFAAVEAGMVLHVNRNMAKLVGATTSGSMYQVLVHEAMHIIQYGCSCEEIEGCIRRCGLAHAYSSTIMEQDYSDWIWLAEGSAERMASLYAGVEPMTYTNYVNYIASLNLATVLQPDVPANYVETLYFYSDLDRLFTLFGATTEEEKQEIYQMIYALEIMQSEPGDVKEAYKKHYGTEWSDQIRDEVNNTVKRPIVQTLTKCFLNHLAEAIRSNSISKNDFLFLLNLYESTINYHLRLDNENHDQYNGEFVAWYGSLQSALFASLENVTAEDYEQYVSDDGAAVIHAGMNWLDEQKQSFLISRFEANRCEYKFG